MQQKCDKSLQDSVLRFSSLPNHTVHIIWKAVPASANWHVLALIPKGKYSF